MQKELHYSSEIKSSVAMTVTLISFSMLFATLMLGYVVYRSTLPSWPPTGMGELPLGLPILSTLTIMLSSLLLTFCESNFSKGLVKVSKVFLNLSFLMGLSFLILQFFLWESLKVKGIYASSGIFGSLIYGLTWIHAAHILGGLGLLLWARIKILPREFEDNTQVLKLKSVGLFWHFLGVVWIVMFVGLFLV